MSKMSAVASPVLALVVLALVVGAVACGDDDAALDGEMSGTVLVMAAASLSDGLGEVAEAFEAEHPGLAVQLNLAGSSSLREQILGGAPADVFASANLSNMEQVVQAGEVVGEPQVFAANLLQIAVPAGNPGGVTGLDDFARSELLIGLCSEGVPCGDLAREALANAGVDASIDTNESDVRALLTKIAADELDAGIVYLTDVRAAGELVEGVDITSEHNVVALYPIARLVSGPNPVAAEAFVAFVLSEQGRSILAAHGFAAP